jgi:hypothetical protein
MLGLPVRGILNRYGALHWQPPDSCESSEGPNGPETDKGRDEYAARLNNRQAAEKPSTVWPLRRRVGCSPDGLRGRDRIGVGEAQGRKSDYRVNHNRLLAKIAERVSDKRLLKLLRAFLQAGVMDNGLVSPQSASRRTSDEQRDATPHEETQASGEQREECGGSTMGTEVSGIRL